MMVCDDCKKSTYDAVRYVSGDIRCKSCANILGANIAEERRIKQIATLEAIKKVHEISDTCDIEECQDCCDHDYDPEEGMMCLNCSKEYPY